MRPEETPSRGSGLSEEARARLEARRRERNQPSTGISASTADREHSREGLEDFQRRANRDRWNERGGERESGQGNTVEMDEEAGMTGAENKMVETANRGMQHRRLARLVQTEILMVVVPVSPIGAGTKLRAVRAVLEDGAKENAHPGVGTRLRDRLENHRKGAGWISTLKSGKKSKSSWIETGIVTMMKGQW